MARSISVKIPTSTLIAQIENKIAEIDEAIANYPAKRAEYEAEIQKHKTKLVEFVSDYLVKNANRVGYEFSDAIRINDSYNHKVELVFDPDLIEGFPKKPVAPESPNANRYYGNTYSNQRELLEKNLKILKMTSQEEVSASTYGAVMDIL